jgi:hypothetical protein
MSVVPIVAGALLIYATAVNVSAPAKTAARTLSKQTPGGNTRQSQLWIDRPINTLMRDDTVRCETDDAGVETCVTQGQIDNYIRQTYMTEAAQHPGVRLVADAAFA